MDNKGFETINVIPLVDVMLVLLTIVLTTSTFIAAGQIPLSLPKASQTSPQSLKVQTISIDRNGALYFNAAPVSLEELDSALGSLDREAPLAVRADGGIRLQIFIDVLDRVNRRGFKKVAVQAEVKR